MISDTDSSYQPHSFKWLKPLELLVIVFFIVVVAGAGGYWLGIRTNHRAPQSTQRVSFQPSSTITAQPSPYPQTGWVSPTIPYNPTLTPQPTLITQIPATTSSISCPSALVEGDQSQSYTWKTYTCKSLGISFLYPANLKPIFSGIIVDGFNNSASIRYRLTYIFRITKFTTKQSLSDWLKQKNIDNNLYISKRIITQTTFHEYSAYSVKQIPENIEGQVPMGLYIVKVNPMTLYEIEYAIPDPRYPQEDAQEHYLSTAGMQKILDSVTFLTD